MKLFFSLMAGVLITATVGCNRTTDQAASNTDPILTDPSVTIDEADTFGTGIQSVADRNLTIRPDTVGPTASLEEPAVSNAQPPVDDSKNTFTETEVVGIDTVATNVKYDINRKVIEQVDTVGATKTYEIRRRIVKRTVTLDTVVETLDKQQDVAYEKGNYKVTEERQLEDTVVEKTITNTARNTDPAEVARPANQTPATTDTAAIRTPVNTPVDTSAQSNNRRVLRVTVDTTAQSRGENGVKIINADSVRNN